jgi:hypothetical protein
MREELLKMTDESKVKIVSDILEVRYAMLRVNQSIVVITHPYKRQTPSSSVFLCLECISSACKSGIR